MKKMVRSALKAAALLIAATAVFCACAQTGAPRVSRAGGDVSSCESGRQNEGGPASKSGLANENSSSGGRAEPSESCSGDPNVFSGVSESVDSSSAGETVRVIYDPAAEGLSPQSRTIAKGSKAPAPDYARDGCVLGGWLCGGVPYDFSKPVTEDLTLSAEWLEKTNLPTVIANLYTETGKPLDLSLVDKAHYASGVISVVNEEGGYEAKFALAGFKGRGNGSWYEEKKSYKLRFDEKYPLFGRAPSKHWVLLPTCGFNDFTLLRNFAAFQMADLLFDGIEYSPFGVLADLYVNGQYRGVYLFCEQIRAEKGRVEIRGASDAEDPGFLIEYDAYAKGLEGIDYFSVNDRKSKIVSYPFTVHYPDPDDYASGKVSKNEFARRVSYIRDYVKRVYTAAIVDHDFETLSSLVEIDSLVDIYILEEFFKNTDAGYSSFYLYKKPGGKLCFGPPWDFDGSTVGARGEEYDATGIYVADSVRNYDVWGNTMSELFYELYRTEPFLELVKARWRELSPGIERYCKELFTAGFYAENKYAFGRNFVKWQKNGYQPGEDMTARQWRRLQTECEGDWVRHCRDLKTWFDRRVAYLNNEWALH